MSTIILLGRLLNMLQDIMIHMLIVPQLFASLSCNI